MITRRSIATAVLCALSAGMATAQPHYYGTKTPYQPQQAVASYAAPPPGYRAVHTQMLARHGSRGLSSMKSDLALYRLWQQAEQAHALTPLGARLGPDIAQMMRANALLGYGVKGIRKPGYGNETQLGIREHTQLAQRLRQRLPDLFSSLQQAPRQIVVLTSGKDRAVDSGYFFAQSLIAQQPELAASVVYPPSLAPRAEQDHSSRTAGTDRYLLYFHKLGAPQDSVSDPADPLYQTFQRSQSYQQWLKSPELRAANAAVLAQPQLADAAQAVLGLIFKPEFIAALGQGRYRAANDGSMRHTSNDGQFTVTLNGDGEEVIGSALDAALALYELYAAAADMPDEVSADFSAYLPAPQAAVFAAAEDAIAFYSKGPGIAETDGINYRMAQTLLDDFFAEAEAIAAGQRGHAAKLRFAHAETVIPLAALLGIPGAASALPRGTPFSYASSAWRGEQVAPMAANIQWDLYAHADGRLLVRMLHNERETDFKPACNSARIATGSHFYDYRLLAACYRH
ncbi:MAG: histidine-type phosphatase [Sphingomonadaceae bacterium]